MSTEVVTREQRGPIALLTLNRPDKLNAVDLAVLAELRRHLDEIEADPQSRVVVIRGAGRVFCAGADLAMVTDLVDDAPAFAEFMQQWHDTYSRIAAFPLPTVAAVHGVALAGGFELMQVCDLVVIADDARVGDQHSNFGLFPGGGSTQRLTRQTSVRNATWLLFSGEWIDGTTAVEWGLANRVVPESHVVEEAVAMADALAQKSSTGLAAIKRALALGEGRPVEEALALERPIALEHMGSPDASIGLAAFASRTKPVFGER